MGKLYDSLLHATYIVDILPVSHGMYFNTVEKFIRYGETVDFAIVATPTPLHFKCSKMLLLHGYNVLCEKPVCFSSSDAKELETLAKEKKLLFYQSTLERYNPAVKYFKKTIELSEIDYITSYRLGMKPPWDYECDPLYDLGIHDVDLWFYLTKKKIPWKLYCGYGNPRREITIYLKRKGKIVLDLLNKSVYIDDKKINLSDNQDSNPIIEMVSDLVSKKCAMNEQWSREIELIEKSKGSGFIDLDRRLR